LSLRLVIVATLSAVSGCGYPCGTWIYTSGAATVRVGDSSASVEPLPPADDTGARGDDAGPRGALSMRQDADDTSRIERWSVTGIFSPEHDTPCGPADTAQVEVSFDVRHGAIETVALDVHVDGGRTTSRTEQEGTDFVPGVLESTLDADAPTEGEVTLQSGTWYCNTGAVLPGDEGDAALTWSFEPGEVDRHRDRCVDLGFEIPLG